MELKIVRRPLSDGSMVYDLLVSGEGRHGDPQEILLDTLGCDAAWDLACGFKDSVNKLTTEQISTIMEVTE